MQATSQLHLPLEKKPARPISRPDLSLPAINAWFNHFFDPLEPPRPSSSLDTTDSAIQATYNAPPVITPPAFATPAAVHQGLQPPRSSFHQYELSCMDFDHNPKPVVQHSPSSNLLQRFHAPNHKPVHNGSFCAAAARLSHKHAFVTAMCSATPPGSPLIPSPCQKGAASTPAGFSSAALLTHTDQPLQSLPKWPQACATLYCATGPTRLAQLPSPDPENRAPSVLVANIQSRGGGARLELQ